MNRNLSVKIRTFEIKNYDIILKLYSNLNKCMKVDDRENTIFTMMKYICDDIGELILKDSRYSKEFYSIFITYAGEKIHDISDFDVRRVYAISLFYRNYGL